MSLSENVEELLETTRDTMDSLTNSERETMIKGILFLSVVGYCVFIVGRMILSRVIETLHFIVSSENSNKDPQIETHLESTLERIQSTVLNLQDRIVELQAQNIGRAELLMRSYDMGVALAEGAIHSLEEKSACYYCWPISGISRLPCCFTTRTGAAVLAPWEENRRQEGLVSVDPREAF